MREEPVSVLLSVFGLVLNSFRVANCDFLGYTSSSNEFIPVDSLSNSSTGYNQISCWTGVYFRVQFSMLKQTFAALLRRTRLIYKTDLLRYYFAYLRNYGKIAAYRKQNPGRVLPRPYMIYETYRLDYQRYFEKGRESASDLIAQLKPFKELMGCHILDWGCGPARIIRHLPELLPQQNHFYGSDYNSDYVHWCQANLPGISFSKNGTNPPLDFPDNRFDVIYGISILTHLSEENHEAWLRELIRVLKPGGILLLTTHGDITRENLTATELTQYDAGKLVVRGGVKEGHRMFTAYQPPSFMKSLVAQIPGASVRHHQPGQKQAWGFEQDTWFFSKA